MAVLLLVLKIVGVVLLAALALVVLALLIPAGADVDFRAGTLGLWVRYGPVKLRLLPPKSKKPEKQEKPEQPEQETPAAKPPEPPKPSQPPSAAPQGQAEAAESAAPNPPNPTPPEAPPPKAQEPPPQRARGLPACIRTRVDALLAFAENDPPAALHWALDYAGRFGKALLRRVKIRRLRVFWTVTAQQADETAVLYAAALTGLNNALVLLRQYMRVDTDTQPHALWLEPDFTGERRAERAVSCRVRACPGAVLLLALHLLWRLRRDPVLNEKPQ